MRFKAVLLCVVITSFLQDVQSGKLKEKSVGYSDMLQRVMNIYDETLPYQEPDINLGRKPFDDSVVLYVETRDTNKVNNTTFMDKDDLMDYFINKYGNKSLKPIRRALKKRSKEQVDAQILKEQQEKKINEIVLFLKDHYLTTNYIYDEVRRIARQRRVRDDLRRMVEYLERPGRTKMKESVLQCYLTERKIEPAGIMGFKDFKTNNLVINTVGDPYNEGYIN